MTDDVEHTHRSFIKSLWLVQLASTKRDESWELTKDALAQTPIWLPRLSPCSTNIGIVSRNETNLAIGVLMSIWSWPVQSAACRDFFDCLRHTHTAHSLFYLPDAIKFRKRYRLLLRCFDASCVVRPWVICKSGKNHDETDRSAVTEATWTGSLGIFIQKSSRYIS